MHEELDAITTSDEDLAARDKKLADEVAELKAQNEKLADENAELKAQNERLLGQCGAIMQPTGELVRAVSAEDADGAISKQLVHVPKSLSQAAAGALATIQQGSPHAATQRKGIDPKGVLAQFLKSRDAKLSIAHGKALWTEVFEVDWQGDLAVLPVDCFEETDRFEPFWRLRSRSMFDRVKALGNNELAAGLTQAAICNWWLDQLDFSQPKDIALQAAACGSVPMLKYLVHESKTYVSFESIYIEACAHGHVEFAKQVEKSLNQASYRKLVADEAAAYGRVDVLEWIAKKAGVLPTASAIDRVVANWCLHMLPVLRKCIPETFRRHRFATLNGRSCDDVIDWFGSDDVPSAPADALSAAVEEEYVDAVKWLLWHTPNTQWHAGDLAAARELMGRSG
ncbi:hypothetical protein HK105_208376 [Polyrhizophydium stewartii]|uniref:Ankyrin repeat protein n=1 Tax=Polyrhizophydium stewartii TaxID=2732419 RepID=A0ABR4MY28_9FUNG